MKQNKQKTEANTKWWIRFDLKWSSLHSLHKLELKHPLQPGHTGTLSSAAMGKILALKGF